MSYDDYDNYDYDDYDNDELNFDADIYNAFLWAWNLTNKNNWVVIDTETTGLAENDEIIDLAIISNHGSTMFNSLIKPNCFVSYEAREVHHISDEMLQNAPSFTEVYPKIKEILTDKLVIIYNKNFDMPKLNYCCKLHNLEPIKFESDCAMLWYAKYYNSWHSYWEKYIWQKLPNTNRNKHRAQSDARACWELIKKMAIPLKDNLFIKPRLFPKKQIFAEWKKWLDFNLYIYNKDRFVVFRKLVILKIPYFYISNSES